MTDQLNGIVTQLMKLLSEHSMMDAKANSPAAAISSRNQHHHHVQLSCSLFLVLISSQGFKRHLFDTAGGSTAQGKRNKSLELPLNPKP